ncbi:MAG: polysaccharide biosynthesis tyrosine autokinase [Actinomycetota bacterium]
MLAATWYTQRQDPAYEATARVLLAEDASTRTLEPGSQNPAFLGRELENDISLALGPEVEALVESRLGTVPDMTVTPETETDILEFRARTGSADSAVEAANVWAESYLQVKQDRELASIETAINGLETRLADLRTAQDELRAPLETLRRQIRSTTNAAAAARLQQDYDLLADELRFDLDLNTAEAQTTVDDLAALRLQAELVAAGQNRLTEPAQPPDGPANTPLSRILVIAVIAGLIIGIGLAVLAEARDDSIRTLEDLQELTDLPILAAVPTTARAERPSIGLATLTDPEGIHADAFHKVRSALEFELLDRESTSVMVTSPDGGEGRSTVATNLALALSSVGTRTVLADIDFRDGVIHQIFGIEREPGLADLVRRDVEASRVAKEIPGETTRDLVVVPSGSVPASPAAFVATPRFLKTVTWMSTQADLVIIDAPPLLAIPETHTLGRHVDAVIVTVMAGRTARDRLRDTLTELEQIDANVVGLVLIGVPKTKDVVRRYYQDPERRNRPWARTTPAIGPFSAQVPAPPSATVGVDTAEPPSAAEMVDAYTESDGNSLVPMTEVETPPAGDPLDGTLVERVTEPPEQADLGEPPAGEIFGVPVDGEQSNGTAETAPPDQPVAEQVVANTEPVVDPATAGNGLATAAPNGDHPGAEADAGGGPDQVDGPHEAVEPLDRLGDMSEVDAEEIEAELVEEFDPMSAAVTLELDHIDAQALVAELGQADDVLDDDVVDLAELTDDLVDQNDPT